MEQNKVFSMSMAELCMLLCIKWHNTGMTKYTVFKIVCHSPAQGARTNFYFQNKL